MRAAASIKRAPTDIRLEVLITVKLDIVFVIFRTFCESFDESVKICLTTLVFRRFGVKNSKI